MGISDRFHFTWTIEAIRSHKDSISQTLPHNPRVLGIGEHSPSPFVNYLVDDRPYEYTSCDLFPNVPDELPCDMNDLSIFFGKPNADIISVFRSSYFITNKNKFFEQIRKIISPAGYLFMDFLIGSSALPVLDFRYGDRRAASIYNPDQPAVFQTTFYDNRLVQEFRDQLNLFCKHARCWPIDAQWNYFRHFPKYYLQDVRSLSSLTPDNIGQQMKKIVSDKNLVSLEDFEKHGFEIIAFSSRYFYPQVKKFNYYIFVAARVRN